MASETAPGSQMVNGTVPVSSPMIPETMVLFRPFTVMFLVST